MPASMWIALVLLLASLTPYGAFFVLLFVWATNCSMRLSPALAGSPSGESDRYQTRLHLAYDCCFLPLGVCFLYRLCDHRRNSRNENAAIVLFGFLLASVISIHQLKGWAGV